MKRLVVISVFLIFVQSVVLLSPALAQDPVNARAHVNLSTNVTITGLKAKPRVGDKITVNGTVSSSFFARGRANNSVDDGNLAAAGAAGATGWIAGAANPTGSLVALTGGAPVIAAAGAVAAKNDNLSGPQTFTLSGILPIEGLANIMGAFSGAAGPTGKRAEATAAAYLLETTPDRFVQAYSESRAVVQKDGDVRTNAEVGADTWQNFRFSFVIDRTGQWTVGGGALTAAIAGSILMNVSEDWSLDPIDLPSSIDIVDYEYAYAYELFLYCLSFWAYGLEKSSEWKPVGEHIVFNGLPAHARWGDLRRLELDGRWTYVPPLKPADQLPSPVHADLMIHGYAPCAYALRVCDSSGSCQAPRYFTVNWTGSEGVQIYDYPSLSTTSPTATTPTF